MAWTTPKTWSVGQLVSATDLNEQVRDNMNHLKLVVDDNGKIPALSSTYFADLSGTNLTNVSRLAADDAFTAGKHDYSAGAGTRLLIQVGADRWAT